jgi:hypothetical protein
MSDEIKKDEQAPEVKTEPSGESLPASELDKVVGGGLSYAQIQYHYVVQEGGNDISEPSKPPTK